ncbi:magnesium transporter [Acidimicrobiia bacterium EGI L10123]|uniref:magnesium transporter n=1 Tax=Salinilacustrithrix flava TaxID=2957203 RepID=UPI003D7C2C45|nr:magnesium transporter [Acidimicrobiia bacterium EGI L10123]
MRSSTATEQLHAQLVQRNLDDGAELLRAAPPTDAAEALRRLESGHQALLLDRVGSQRRPQLLALMPPDERARMLTDSATAESWVDELPAAEAAETRRLLQYPPESVGRMMTQRMLELSASDRVAAALDRVRRCEPEVDTVYRLPVTDAGMFVGMVELRDLLSAEDDDHVGAHSQDVRADALSPDDDQEVAARRVLSTEALAVPVLDAEGALLGVVTIDDAMEVLGLEEAEDAAKTSGVDPLRRPYLTASLLRLVRSRAVWLVVAASAGVLTVQVLDHFEGELEEVVALALFIPLLLGTGGNIGAQAATTVVRAMAVDDLRIRDLPRVVWREASVGVMLGGLLAVLAALPIALAYEPKLAAVVCLTLVTVCVIGTSAGSVLPLVVGRVGGDPAVVSAPFITTLVDATGLLVYFAYARMVFGL